MRKPIISLNVIVQDSENDIRRQLLACDGHFDIIRYCDGGSTDGTKKIIKRWRKRHPGPHTKIEYHRRKWDDDYASQDNVLLDSAKDGEWAMIMDSDEIPSEPLLRRIREYAVDGLGYDMISMPCLLILNDVPVVELNTFMEIVGSQPDPFRKLWFFKYDSRVKSFGSPHREVKRLQDQKDPWGDDRYLVDWKILEISEPYYHIKTKMQFAWNDVLHAWLDPYHSEYTKEDREGMYGNMPKFNDMSEVKIWLQSDIPKPMGLIEWAYKNRARQQETIRSWWPVICECHGKNHKTTNLESWR